MQQQEEELCQKEEVYLALQVLRQEFCYFSAACEKRAPDLGSLQNLSYHLAIAMNEVNIVHGHAAMMQHAYKHLHNQTDPGSRSKAFSCQKHSDM